MHGRLLTVNKTHGIAGTVPQPWHKETGEKQFEKKKFPIFLL